MKGHVGPDQGSKQSNINTNIRHKQSSISAGSLNGQKNDRKTSDCQIKEASNLFDTALFPAEEGKFQPIDLLLRLEVGLGADRVLVP